MKSQYALWAILVVLAPATAVLIWTMFSLGNEPLGIGCYFDNYGPGFECEGFLGSSIVQWLLNIYFLVFVVVGSVVTIPFLFIR